MKRWLVVLFVCAFLPASAAFAQQPGDPATKEDVQKLFDRMNSRKMFDSLVTVMKQQLPVLSEAAVKKQLPNASPEEMRQMKTFINGQVEQMYRSVPLEEMMQAMIPAYQHHFTHQEVQELIQFYSSPIGTKLLAQMPAIMSEGMEASRPVMQKWIDAQMAQLVTNAEDHARKMRNKAPVSSTAKPAS